jgi:hypothetical protein
LAPGAIVIIAPEWRQHYRKGGAAVAGIVTEVAPCGTVARVRLDEYADTFICTAHLYQAYPPEVDPETAETGDWRIVSAISAAV